MVCVYEYVFFTRCNMLQPDAKNIHSTGTGYSSISLLGHGVMIDWSIGAAGSLHGIHITVAIESTAVLLQ